MKKNVPLMFLLGLAMCQTAVFAQHRPSKEVRAIDTYVSSVDRAKKRRTASMLVFADTADYAIEGKGKWQKFASERALEKHRETSETYTIALNWQKGGKIVSSNFTLFSPSGDWAKYVYQYYRPDGSLARAESEVRTFQGDYIAIQRVYFDYKGKLIRTTTRYLDLYSKKPKKRDPNWGDESSIFGYVDYFKSTSKLPFAHLLKKK